VRTDTELFEDLVKRCAKRDNAARKQLYDMFSAQMFSICLRYTKNRSQAEDVFQESFLKVFENIGSIKNVAALPGWIKMIFVHTSIDFLRMEMKFNLHDTDVSEQKIYVDQDIISDMSVAELNELIQELPVKSRTVFNLYVVEGYSHREISEIMGISEGTSKSQLFDAKQKLKKKLNTLNQPLLKIVV
jgi:RNA polymerase sigma-70 factor (ECF subfamily)